MQDFGGAASFAQQLKSGFDPKDLMN